MRGLPISEGIAHGKVLRVVMDPEPVYTSIGPDKLEEEIERLRKGRDAAGEELKNLIVKVREEMGDDKAEIFEGHLEMLMSEDLDEEIAATITNQGICAEEAARIFGESNAREMEELDDPYFRERGQDFRDIARQLIQGITGGGIGSRTLPPDTIIVSDELTPSQTAALDMSRVKGFIVHKGGANSHVAIISRSMEIPAIVLSDPNPVTFLQDGASLSMDGYTGQLWVSATEDVVMRLNAKKERIQKEKEVLLSLLDLPSETADGKPLGLYANAGGTYDLQAISNYKADGIGLFRTEFLFMESLCVPTLARQEKVYRAAVKAMEGRTVIIRLLDTGADKPLPYWQLPAEDNPFLGVRGIRLLFEKEEILRTQIQALLLASKAGPVGMMIPMIASLKQIERVRALLEEEKKALDWKGPDNLKFGVMIETPAAVQLIEEILDMVDFISIGTNDLTQYLLAADRGNPSVTAYYDEFHPAVIRSIAHVIKQSRKKNVLNGLCGELAGNRLALPIFIGLGVNELSANPSQIPELKNLLRRIDSGDAEKLVKEILRLPTSEGIQARLKSFLKERNLLK